MIFLRNSASSGAEPIALCRTEWQEFLTGIKDSAFDKYGQAEHLGNELVFA